MDIAAFVGLAASGPLHTPVAVEDIARFREIFGDDLQLAWDDATGKMQHAHLGSAVEAFFRNGGRRCWVVRVARDAQTHAFPLPGLVRADNWRPALARARCGGSWSDTLTVGTVRSSQALAVARFEGASGRYSADLIVAPVQVLPGDLLQLGFGGGGPLLLLVVDAAEAVPSGQRVRGTGHWFLRHVESSPPLVATRAVLLLPDGERSLPLGAVHRADEVDDRYQVEVALTLEEAPAPGDLLRIDFEGGHRLLLPVEEVEAMTTGVSPPDTSVRLNGGAGLWPVEASEGLALAEAWQASGSPLELRQPLAERLTFQLWVWRGREVQASLQNLTFSPRHPRCWTHLPLDDDLFRPAYSEAAVEPGPLAGEASDPRFPLAGPAKERRTTLYLPLGMPLRPDPATSHGPLGDVSPDNRLHRDGVADFGAHLFVDRDLAPIGCGALLTEAHHKRYVRRQPLRGLHSLLPLEEVSLIVVPDAVQRGWKKDPVPLPTPLGSPELDPVPQPDELGVHTLSWSPVEGATAYRLEEALDPAFTQLTRNHQGERTTASLSIQADCPRRTYYRVRAMRGGEVGPWSNTESATVPRPEFEVCEDTTLAAPELESLTVDEDDLILQWSAVEGATGYTVRQASDPIFGAARTFDAGSGTALRLKRPPDQVTTYQVRARRDGEVGPWSNTEFLVPSPRRAWAVRRPADYTGAHLLAVQRALLRFCAARGDLLALLAMPRHYRQEKALAHVAALTSPGGGDEEATTDAGHVRVRPLTAGEVGVLSYGALFHPWTATRSEGHGAEAAIRLIPPDGAVCGTVAARAGARGAWVAPANEPIKDVISLEPAIGRQGWASLFDAQVNVIRRDPRGFLLLSADTLSPDASLRPINVRRLLILLRRLALREGMTYVFEPNRPAFHRLVQHRFDRLLAGLYTRGAFAGDAPETAYQVVVNEGGERHSSVDTSASLERGRLIVDLRVAPSRPLAFITVRLIQVGHEELAIQEV
jgi:hypothetical protein